MPPFLIVFLFKNPQRVLFASELADGQASSNDVDLKKLFFVHSSIKILSNLMAC
jgi:hypothetical protein